MAKQTGKYHHGNLRQVLFEEALRILATEGKHEISLRAIARNIGVSPNAPYRHFSSRDVLLETIGAYGFQQLESKLGQISEDGAVKRFRAVGEVVEKFARENPALIRLMFGQQSTESGANLQESRSRCFLLVAEFVRVVMSEVTINEKVFTAAVSAWSLYFGYAILSIDGNLPIEALSGSSGGKEMGKLLARGLKS